MKRRDFLQAISAASALSLTQKRGRSQPSSAQPPNIIFIMCDDLGYGHLGCYGQEKIRTPNIDRLAGQGMRFTQCYSGAPVCAPSRSVLMTGLHTGHTPVRGNTGGIPLKPEDFTVAELLKKQGYNTGLVGKWGLGEHGTTGVPYKQGFDEFFGWLHQIHAHFYYPEYLWHNDERFVLEANDGLSGRYAHDEVIDKAMDFLRRQASLWDLPQPPFFLYLPLAIPHYELLVPEDSLKEYRGTFPETPYRGRGRGTGYPVDYAAQETPKAAIAAMITHMDKNIGRLMQLLEKLNLAQNTIVFFTSDNGPSYGPGGADYFNAAGGRRGLKASLFEGGIRVPLIARWPNKIEPGSVNDHVCYFPDFMPTLAELAGTHPPSSTDGISILPTLLGKPDSEKKSHEFLYWEYKGGWAIRMGKWKAIKPPSDEVDSNQILLFDLEADPQEQNDLSAQHPEIVSQAKQIRAAEHEKPRPQIEPKKPEGRQYQ